MAKQALFCSTHDVSPFDRIIGQAKRPDGSNDRHKVQIGCRLSGAFSMGLGCEKGQGVRAGGRLGRVKSPLAEAGSPLGNGRTNQVVDCAEFSKTSRGTAKTRGFFRQGSRGRRRKILKFRRGHARNAPAPGRRGGLGRFAEARCQRRGGCVGSGRYGRRAIMLPVDSGCLDYGCSAWANLQASKCVFFCIVPSFGQRRLPSVASDAAITPWVKMCRLRRLFGSFGL